MFKIKADYGAASYFWAGVGGLILVFLTMCVIKVGVAWFG